MNRVVLNTSYCIAFAVLFFLNPFRGFWNNNNSAVMELSSQELSRSAVSGEHATSLTKETTVFDFQLLDTMLADTICAGDSILFNGVFIKETGQYLDTLKDINDMDSIITLDLVVNDTFFNEVILEVCMGDTLFVGDTLQFFSDTSLFVNYTTVNGCDSTIRYLVIQRPMQGKITEVEIPTCLGDSALYQGQFYKKDTILRIFQTAEGCDSVIHLKLLPLDTFRTAVSETICEGDTITLGSQRFTSDTVYTEVFPAVNGCDSTVVYTLNVLDSAYTQIDTMFCADDTLFVDQYVITTDTLIFLDTLQAANGCDSVIALSATAVTELITNIDETICEGDSIEYKGAFYKMDTLITDTLNSVMGCDSLVLFQLSVIDTFTNFIDTVICRGQSIIIGDSMYTESAMVTNQFFTPSACITVNVSLTVADTFNLSLDSTVCAGDTVFLGSRPLLMSGMFTDTLQTALGCDSIVSINLTVLDTVLMSMDSTICSGDTVFFGMDTLTMTGVYDQSFTRANGCDSTIRLNLNVLPSSRTVIDTMICSGDTVFFGMDTLTMTGVYTNMFIASNGCDSSIIIDLQVMDTFITKIDTSLCLGDTLDIANLRISSGGAFMQSFQSITGCDSVVMINVVANDTFFINRDVGLCQGDTLFLADTAVTSAGVYTEFLNTIAGCDSTIQYTVSILDTISVSIDSTICQGDTVFVGLDTLIRPGLTRHILRASNGCDSIVNLNLMVLDSFYREDIFTICQGDTLEIDGQKYFESTVVTDVFTAANGCDSTEVLIVNVAPLGNRILDTTICQGDTVFVGDIPLTQEGMFTERLTTVSGCDSIVTVNLTVLPSYNIEIDTTICTGDVIFLGDQPLSNDGFYSRRLQAVNGCDSIVSINLSVIDTFLIQIEDAICEGDTYLFGGQELTSEGVYSQVLSAATGCDSILQLTLTVYPSFDNFSTQTICEGDSIILGETVIKESGQYFAELFSVNGCDSLVTVDLMVLPTYNDTMPIELCENETFIFGGDFITDPGLYTAEFQTVDGCDSIVTIDVSVLPIFSTQVSEVICEGETYTFGTRELSRAGEYSETFTSSSGCDSLVFLTLDITPRTGSSIRATICEGETYEFGANALTETGVYQEAFPGSNGCDSIVTLNLTVIPITRSTINQTICQGETYVFGDREVSESGIYRDTFVAQNGCFIILVLELEVLTSIRDTISASICEGDSYRFGDRSLTQTGVYTQRLNNTSGCDSTIVLNLDVIEAFEMEQNITICEGDTFKLGRQNLTRGGTYIAFLQGQSGCDSTVTINLTVREDLGQTMQITLCQGESYPFFGQNLTEPGTYSEMFTSVGGCDSTITVELSFEEIVPQVTMENGEIMVSGIPDNSTFELLDCNADTVVSQSNSPFFMPERDGDYAIIITSTACRDTTPCINYVTTSTEDILSADLFKLFPNPTRENISIEVDQELYGRYEMQILDMRGKQYMRQSIQLLPKAEVNVSQLPAGLYIVHLLNRGVGTVRLKFLKLE